jgi:putative peptide zinc metalloprotease protein
MLKDFEIKKFDTVKWLVVTQNNNHILVNSETKDLLEIIKSSKENSQILENFNVRFNKEITFKDLQQLLKNNFADKDLLIEETNFKKKTFLSLKVKVIPERIASVLSSPFTKLFNPTFFWYSFVLLLILNVMFLMQYFTLDLKNLEIKHFAIYTILLCSTMLIHELGHIGACKYFKIKHGEIGFGFYIIFPILYADVSNIWALDKNKRIITNLAGIYLELLYSIILIITSLIIGQSFLLLVSFTILIKALTELNPFIRYDGYWVLSDITNSPNLLKRSNKVVLNFIKKPASIFKEIKLGRKNIFYLVYGTLNFLIISFYLGWLIFNYHYQIFEFPSRLIKSISVIFYDNAKIYNSLIPLFNFDNILIIGFYVIILKLSISYIIRKSKLYLTGMGKV